jgi:tetratricopeptide (TPR) repeat protein
MTPSAASGLPAASVPTGRVEVPATASASGSVTRVPILASLFVGLFGILVASFPARNVDLWKYLADGRDLLRGSGGFDVSWLYGVVTYAVFSVVGGAGLVAAKALLCGAVAVLMFRMSATKGGWRIALAVTGLAVLAMGNRLLLQPATISVLLLAISLWLLLREEARSATAQWNIWPGWRWVVLFAIWTSVDGRVVLGLGVVALTWLGRLMDAPQPGGFGRALGRRVASIAILVAVACVSPSHVGTLSVPPELRSAVVSLRQGVSAESPVNSPFERDYRIIFRDSPAALSYYPLLALGLLSFLLNRRGWRWSWFLPWLGLAVVSGLQVRLVPFFAVVAGPATAWNLQEYFARRGAPSLIRPRLRYAAFGLASLLAAAFLVAAWPGWLQGPPFEPRRWVVETPVALRQGADFLRRSHASGLWPAGTHTLHAASDTASAFAWFCPEDRGLRDDDLINLLLTSENPDVVREGLRARSISRIVVYADDSSKSGGEVLSRLLADPEEWPVMHLTGGLVVFGWRDPARGVEADPFAGHEVDFARLAFRPDASEVAPPVPPSLDSRWWDAFWKPAPPQRPPGRDEATVLFKKSQAMLRAAPLRHQRAWEASQMAGLVGAGGGWLGPPGPIDASVRLNLFSPPISENAPLPAFTRAVLALYQKFAFDRGDAPVGTLYAAIRAARRAVAENPNDAKAYLVLGSAYGSLVGTSAERSWAGQFPQLRRLRQLQASAALNRAVALNPKLAQAHLQLSRLYLSLQILDLAVLHLRSYQEIPARWGGPRRGDPQAEALESELNHWTRLLDEETHKFAKESEKALVTDRALMAVRHGLGGHARDLLLKSDIAAFGAVGMELELNLLLATGRPDEVLGWTTPEVRGSLGDFLYHSLRAQAFIAAGEYEAADPELAEMIGPGGRLPAEVGMVVAGLVGKALLDEQPGGFSRSQFIWSSVGSLDYETRITEIAQRLARSADVLVLRGLVSLESGNIDRARESFRASLALSPNRWGGGQLAYRGRQIAWACLALIDGPTDFQPAR